MRDGADHRADTVADILGRRVSVARYWYLLRTVTGCIVLSRTQLLTRSQESGGAAMAAQN
jgi:hypothetical protein